MDCLQKIFFFICMVVIVKGGIHDLDGKKLYPDSMYNLKSGIYSPDEAPANTSPGNGKAYVDMTVTMNRDENGTNGQIHALVFHSSKKSKIGILDGDKKTRICCSQDLKTAKKCNDLGELLVPSSEVDNITLWIEKANFLPNQTNFVLDKKFGITKSGVYYTYLVNCRSSDTGIVTIDGVIAFLNPYGYLNAEYYPFMPFFATLASLYLVLAIVWFILSARRWKQLLTLQNWISGVIALGMVESATFYFDYLGYNISGRNYIGAMIVGVLISTLKRTVSRILVLVVSMGYGVVKPTLGTAWYKIMFLGVLYLIFSGVLNVVDLIQRSVVVPSSVMFFLVFPVALLDTGFYWWIFLSLMRTISQLQLRKQSIKLEMYKRFFITLVASGILSALIILVQMFLTVSLDVDSSWQFLWLWSAIWQILYFVILVAIAILWRPTENNTRYSYTEMPPEPDEFMLQPLNVFGEGSQRRVDAEEIPKELVLDPNISASFTISDEDSQSNKLD